MGDDIHLYCMSNGSEIQFPENTLTKFKSKLPFKIEWKKDEPYRWFVALEGVGFDPNFTSPYLPKKDSLPSMIIATLPNFADIGVKKLSYCAGLDKLPENCSADKLDKLLKKATALPYSDIVYYFQENVNYNTRRYYKFLKNLETYGAVNVKYEPKYFTFEITATSDKPVLLFTHVALHNNLGIILNKVWSHPEAKKHQIQDMDIVTIDKEIYFCYTINAKQYIQINIRSDNIIKIPDIVKVKSSFIREQIFNNRLTKDFVCFSPIIKTNSRYSFYEAEAKNFLQLANTTLDVLDFKLVDENDRQLPLHEGTPTFVKLHFKKMDAFKKSFHIRVSSEYNGTNEMSNFKVTLPSTLYFNRDWKVAMTSILIPGKFCTVPIPGEVLFSYKKPDGDIVSHKEWLPMREFKKDEIIEWLNEFFSSHTGTKIAQVNNITGPNDYEPTLEFKFFTQGVFVMSEHLCRVLGYGAEDFTKGKKPFVIKFKPGETKYKLKMSNSVNIDYYRPNYIMAYANIVEPTPINSEMTNLLKVFQVSSDRTFMLYEFKHLEHHRLLNDVVNDIHIELRTHAGDLVRFEKKSNSEVIVNLLFSNYE